VYPDVVFATLILHDDVFADLISSHPYSSRAAQVAKVTTFALKMRVSATHVVQQVEEFLSAAQKALDKLGSGSEEGDDTKDDE
jgi:hypothetical protein